MWLTFFAILIMISWKHVSSWSWYRFSVFVSVEQTINNIGWAYWFASVQNEQLTRKGALQGLSHSTRWYAQNYMEDGGKTVSLCIWPINVNPSLLRLKWFCACHRCMMKLKRFNILLQWNLWSFAHCESYPHYLSAERY